jgi:hypothetical protein
MGGVLTAVAENEQALLAVVTFAVGVGVGERLDQTLTQHFDGGRRSERDRGYDVARARGAAAAQVTGATVNHAHLKREVGGRLAEGRAARVKRAGIDRLRANATQQTCRCRFRSPAGDATGSSWSRKERNVSAAFLARATSAGDHDGSLWKRITEERQSWPWAFRS